MAGFAAFVIGVVLFAVVVCFAFFWPIWTDELLITGGGRLDREPRGPRRCASARG